MYCQLDIPNEIEQQKLLPGFSFEVIRSNSRPKVFGFLGMEKLELIGTPFNALILDKLNHKTGLKVRLWLDTETENLLVKVDVAIGDLQALSW